MTELLGHLRFDEHKSLILKTSNCIPCMMPYITSQFLVRSHGDRPDVVPAGSTNLAFIGQYAEVPDDVVFTVEYSVRTAQVAVATLLNWYRAGVDVQARLPQLSTWLGHINPASTYRYLQAAPELLAQAAARLEHAAVTAS